MWWKGAEGGEELGSDTPLPCLFLAQAAGCCSQKAQEKHFPGMEESSDSPVDAGSPCGCVGSEQQSFHLVLP